MKEGVQTWLSQHNKGIIIAVNINWTFTTVPDTVAGALYAGCSLIWCDVENAMVQITTDFSGITKREGPRSKGPYHFNKRKYLLNFLQPLPSPYSEWDQNWQNKKLKDISLKQTFRQGLLWNLLFLLFALVGNKVSASTGNLNVMDSRSLGMGKMWVRSWLGPFWMVWLGQWFNLPKTQFLHLQRNDNNRHILVGLRDKMSECMPST